MFSRPILLLSLLVAISHGFTYSYAQADEGLARHMDYLQKARMLKRRNLNIAPTAPTVNDTNPCKRESDSETSFGHEINLKIMDATSNITILTDGRQPLNLGDSSSSSQGQPESETLSEAASSSSSGSSHSSTLSSTVAVPSVSASTSSGNGMKAVHTWTGSDFQNWEFFTDADPTNGDVNYVSQQAAQSQNLISTANGQFKIAVSTGSLVSGNRNSVRISSPQNWKKGQLVVASFGHMPEGCGTWPAFWSMGAKTAWPAGGEIDILEGVNSVAGNLYTLHTTDGCTLTGGPSASSGVQSSDCSYQPGCSYRDSENASFGPDFNSAGGGVYASHFDDSGIKIWFWSAGNVPSSITSGSPDMSTFGEPKAFYDSSSCDIDSYFDDEQMLIINTTLMGDWAGSTFWSNGCTGTIAGTLADASNFDNAFWLVDYVKIYG